MYLNNKLKTALIFMVCGLYSVSTNFCYAVLPDGQKLGNGEDVNVAQNPLLQGHTAEQRGREKLEFCLRPMVWSECIALLNDIRSGKVHSMDVAQIAAFLANKNEEEQNVLHYLAKNGYHSLLSRVMGLCKRSSSSSNSTYLEVALNDLDKGKHRPCDLAKDDDTRRVFADSNVSFASPPKPKKRRVSTSTSSSADSNISFALPLKPQERRVSTNTSSSADSNISFASPLRPKKRRVSTSTGSSTGNHDLHSAAKSGDLETVQTLLSSGTVNIKSTDSQGRTALHWAAENGHLEIVQALLKKKRTGIITIEDNEGNTALHLAAAKGYLEIVKALLAQSAQVAGIKDTDGCTALHLATENGHLEIVKALLEKDARIARKKDDSGFTALHLAAANGHSEIVKALLDKNIDTIRDEDCDGRIALTLATENLHWAVVEEIFNKIPFGFNPRYDDETLLHWAAENGHSETVKKLMDKLLFKIKKGDVHVYDYIIQEGGCGGNTPLHLAAKNGHLETLKILLDGLTKIERTGNEHFRNLKKRIICSKNDIGYTPLDCAFKYNRMDIVEYLLSHCDDKIIKDLAVILLFNDSIGKIANDSNGDITRFLLKRFPDDETIKHKMEEYLVNWAARDKWDMVSLIIDVSTEIGVCDELGNTVLHYAAREGNVDIMQKLIDKGADINAKNKDGQTPLCLAVKFRQLEAVKKLLAQDKIEINTFDGFSVSPLHWAVARGDVGIINELLNHKKTDVNICNHIAKYGLDPTPLHWAVERKNLRVVEALLRHKNIGTSVEREKCCNKDTLLEKVKLSIQSAAIAPANDNKMIFDEEELLKLSAIAPVIKKETPLDETKSPKLFAIAPANDTKTLLDDEEQLPEPPSTAPAFPVVAPLALNPTGYQTENVDFPCLNFPDNLRNECDDYSGVLFPKYWA